MPKVGGGVPQPAKLKDIVDDLFENERIKYPDGSREFFTFVAATLTDQQKQSLTSLPGSTPLDFYIYYQVDRFDVNDNLISTSQYVITYVKKNDGFIYGIYFSVSGQTRFEIKELEKSPTPIVLVETAQLTPDNYMEVYNHIFGTTFILGLSTDSTFPLASLQYTKKSKYFYEDLVSTGVDRPDLPETVLIGLSKSLSKFD